jgi:hypothetical protein
VKVLSIGTTDEGRELAVVFVGSDESIQNLEQYRTYLGQLADPRKITDAQARDVIAKAKPIYHLMGGLHSGEVGPSEMLMELAYRLAVEDSPLVRQIRDNVIVSITPVADPDGRDRNVDWFNLYGPQQTEGNPQIGVLYWGKDVFHDDNRDINHSQVSMRRCSTGICSGTRRSCTTCIRHRRCSTPSAARRRRTRPSIRFSTASCRCSRTSRWRSSRSMRHAGRVDARLRRHVVAGISRLHVVESQRHDPHVRFKATTARTRRRCG